MDIEDQDRHQVQQNWGVLKSLASTTDESARQPKAREKAKPVDHTSRTNNQKIFGASSRPWLVYHSVTKML